MRALLERFADKLHTVKSVHRLLSVYKDPMSNARTVKKGSRISYHGV
jgi:hypothetical protein